MDLRLIGSMSIVALLWGTMLGAAGRDVPLVDAARKGDAGAVRALLRHPVDVNAADPEGMTALHWAAQLDDLKTADLLIGRGADVRAATRYAVTPLSVACVNGSAPLIERLLKAGADPNTTSPDGETVLMTAARTGKADAVKALLLRGADVNAKERWRGQTALMWASSEGHAATVQALIDNKADIHARSNAGWNAFLLAVREGHLGIVRLFLTAGASPNDAVKPSAQSARMARGQLPGDDATTSGLVLAIINGHYELAALLLEKGADPNMRDPRGSALHALAFMRRPGSSGGGSPPRQTGNLDSLQLAKALLERGVKPNVRIAWKEIRFDRISGGVRPPPNIAVGANYMSLVGATPFFIAAKGGDVALMRLLVAYGADPLMPTAQQVTPLMAAAGLGFYDGESPGPLNGVPESESLEAVKLALELGNDINAVTDYGPIRLEGEGASLLHRYPLNLDQYVGNEAALGDMRWGGSTALHGAAVRGANSLVSFLVDKGAKLDATNGLGWTPLMIAEGTFVGNSEREWPSTAALLRRLMVERGLAISAPGQSKAPDVRPQ